MNPYRLLNITPTATPREIVQASALALRENTHSARDIAEARKELMNPVSKRILDFVYTVDLDPLLKDVEKGLDKVQGEEIAPLERLDIFDKQV
ncbi:MAG: hypothetical protein D3909_16655 [Candidatus Electrothrix sp. ATG1]|nr:hypothetical protein [Candidatus Electrothrix sp. ATG1]